MRSHQNEFAEASRTAQKKIAEAEKRTDDGKNASPCLTQKAPYKGRCADSGEKHAPASDSDTVTVDSLKALDPNRPIREADIASYRGNVRFVPAADVSFYWTPVGGTG